MNDFQDVSGYITDMTIDSGKKKYFEIVIDTTTGMHYEAILNSETLSKVLPSEYDSKVKFLLHYHRDEAKKLFREIAPAIMAYGTEIIKYIDIETSRSSRCMEVYVRTSASNDYQIRLYIPALAEIVPNGFCGPYNYVRSFVGSEMKDFAKKVASAVYDIERPVGKLNHEDKEKGTAQPAPANTAAACDDTAKAKDSDKEKATEKRPKDWWTQQINDIEFTRVEFDKAKAKQSEKSEAPCDLQCAAKFCEAIFEEKMRIYGYSFCFMHPETVTDQLFMKATILKGRLTDRNKSMRLGFAFFEGIRDEFAAVVNYGIIALRQGGFGVQRLDVPESPMRFYSDQMQAALSLIRDKGAEYGELWREQRIGTFADMIHTKVRRLKGIEDRYRVGGMTEGDYKKFAGDQYKDLINYGLFGIVRMTEIIDYLHLEMEDYESDEEV